MEKIVITKEDKKEFRESRNGMKKLVWQKIGMLIDIIATLGISFLIMYADKLPNSIYFYVILYLLLVVVVVGGEFIGTYFGALEQYVIDKQEKKIISSNEE